jgi:hypothetical protein
MKAATGVSLELAALVCVLGVSPLVPSGAVYVLYVLVAEFLATYLVHCPSHYIVGRVCDIKFTRIHIGQTALVRSLPPMLEGLGRLLRTPTLSTDKVSLASASKSKRKAMYLSGTVASSGSALLVAAVVTYSGSLVAAGLAWLLAVGYLLFDAVFSPRSGDLMRARATMRL